MDETLKLLYPFFDTSFISKITVDAELTGLVYNSVLALIPVTFILIFTPFELWRQTGNQVCHIPWNFMNSMKVILLCIQSNLIIMMALYEVFHSNHPSVFNITVQVILFLTQLHLLYLVKRGKKKGAQTSYIMCTYWLIQTTCSIIDFQSNNSSTFDHWKHKLKCFSFVINVFQLIIATGSCSDHESTHHKDNPLIPPNICPEDNCSIVSKLSFWWLNPLMRKGYERSLTREDLWCLVPNRQCKKVSERFESYWEHKPNFQSCSPLEILIVIYFLWQILGLAIFAGVLIMVIMIPINGLIEKVTQKVQVDVLALKDERIKIVTEIMNGIRILKLYA
ncbi:Canalicular multispecific organic anion transporter 2 [Nymphon striatum]|nr:Canalicular multispecific organic anion transporter 2 [Nymphon striatum]